jgi:hypothetical protein
MRIGVAFALAAIATEVLLIRLGQTYGSTVQERSADLPGDDIVVDPAVVTNHAITIDAPPECVWPWLVQMGWHRGGWYTARWVDRLLFPDNWPSADRILPSSRTRASAISSRTAPPGLSADSSSSDWIPAGSWSCTPPAICRVPGGTGRTSTGRGRSC